MAQDVFPIVHTLTIVEPIWPMLQNLLKTVAASQYQPIVVLNVINIIVSVLIMSFLVIITSLMILTIIFIEGIRNRKVDITLYRSY